MVAQSTYHIAGEEFGDLVSSLNVISKASQYHILYIVFCVNESCANSKYLRAHQNNLAGYYGAVYVLQYSTFELQSS